MKYYVKIKGQFPKETTRDHYRKLARRKGTQDQVWLNGGVKVARCAIVEHF